MRSYLCSPQANNMKVTRHVSGQRILRQRLLVTMLKAAREPTRATFRMHNY